MHCFRDSWEICQDWMESFPNMKFGFCPDVMPCDVVFKLPMSKILLETDSPYFYPFSKVTKTDFRIRCRNSQKKFLFSSVQVIPRVIANFPILA